MIEIGEKNREKVEKSLVLYWIINGIVIVEIFFSNRTFFLMNKIAN